MSSNSGTCTKWIFQARPSYDLSVEIPERFVLGGRSDQWRVSIHLKNLKPGHRALLWQSGVKSGVYGTATILTTPYIQEGEHWVDMKFDPILSRPITRKSLKEDPVLRNLGVIRQPQGTTFPVAEDHWALLQPLLAERQSASHQVETASEPSEFEPENDTDARKRVFASIVRRRGQPDFRRLLLDLYGNACVISGCDAQPALEAAHICPYRGEHTNHPSNGLLLRADLHTLFDLHLITIDFKSKRVILAPQLRKTVYAEFSNKKVIFPSNGPSSKALAAHQAEFVERNSFKE